MPLPIAQSCKLCENWYQGLDTAILQGVYALNNPLLDRPNLWERVIIEF